MDPNLLPITQTLPSNNFFTKFDQWLEYLHDPFLNISIRHFDLQYKSM